MDTAKKLIFSAIILIIPITVNAQSAAGREIANIQSWLNEGSQGYYKPGTGDQWVRNSSPNGDRYVKVESTIDYKASNGRNYPVVIEKTAHIDGSKIGKAVVKMAKFIPPVALGFEVYDLVCQLSDICKKTDSDEWEKSGSEYGDFGYTGIGLQNAVDQACSSPKDKLNYFSYKTSSGSSETYGVIVQDVSTACSSKYGAQGYTVAGNCASDNSCGVYPPVVYYKILSSAYTPPEQPHPPTEQDWEAAETQLNDPRFDEPLLVNGQPVPLANLPILGYVPPITISDTETVNRDSNGNVTGTTRTTTTLEITDSATTERPGSVTATETTTKTDYNTSGQPTGTQTTNSTPPPPEKPTSMQIEFDSVPPSNLETEQVSMTLPPAQSWGEGVCPADLSFTYVGQTYFIRWEPVCNTAEQLRPIVILFASISAMFIVAGVTKTVTA